MKTKLHKKLRNYQITKKTNSFIYFLSEAPVLGYIFHKSLVSEYEVKNVIRFLVKIQSNIFTLFKKVIYIILLILLFLGVSNGFAYFFILLTILGTILRKINRFNRDEYDCVMLLKINSSEYVKDKINSYIVKEFITLALALSIASLSMGIKYIYIIYLLFIYLSIHLIGEALYIKQIEINKYNNPNNKIINFVLGTIIIAFIIYSIMFEKYPLNNTTYLIGIIIVICGIISYLYLITYKHYTEIHKQNLNILKINQQEMNAKNDFTSNENGDINIAVMNKHIVKDVEVKDKKSYAYLYSMLLKRYKSSLNGEFYFTTICSILGALALLFFPKFDYIDPQEYVNTIFNSLSVLFLIMYFVSFIGKKIIKLCFFQIDRYLINYNFYRTEAAIKENLKMRMKTIFIECLIPTIIISSALGLTFIIYSKDLNIINIIIAIIFPIVLSIFYSLYHIGTYYLMQPYSFNGEIVNKTYKALDYIIYIAVYLLFEAEIAFSITTIIIITFVLFMISMILYYLVKKIGIKTFRVK